MAGSVEGPNMGYLPEGYADLPEAVLEHILGYLTTTEVLQAVQVCTTWQAIIDRTNFWFTAVNKKLRMHQRVAQINLILKSKQLSQACQADTLRFLKGICLNREDPSYFLSYIKGTGNNMDIGHSWGIEEEDVMAVSVLLLFRRPLIIVLTLRSDPARIRFIDIFLLILESHKDCNISIRNLGGWRCLLNSNIQPLKQVDAYERCKVQWLWTAIDKSDSLPRTVQHLFLGLLKDPANTEAVLDPDLASVIQRCPKLKLLGLHVRAGSSIEHLPPLPDLTDKYDRPCVCLYLSEVDNNHLEWAVKTARALQSTSGYRSLSLPDCRLQTEQLHQMVAQMADAGMKVTRSLMISSHYCFDDETQLRAATRTSLHCDLTWNQDYNKLPWW